MDARGELYDDSLINNDVIWVASTKAKLYGAERAFRAKTFTDVGSAKK